MVNSSTGEGTYLNRSLAMNGLVKWCCQELAKLHYELPEDTLRYILRANSHRDLEEHMMERLDSSNVAHQKFVTNLLLRWKPYGESAPLEVKVYKKGEAENYVESISKPKKSKKKQVNIPSIFTQKSDVQQSEAYAAPSHTASPECTGPPKKPKPKYVPLYSDEGSAKVVHLRGRHPCQCEASKHALINNCLECGRIVCTQEGSGPCFTCGTLVCTEEEKNILSKNSNNSRKLYEALMGEGETISSPKFPVQQPEGSKIQKGLLKAMEHKNKLLEYDKTVEKRTQVFDDESDYFEVEANRWLSHEERQALMIKQKEVEEKLNASRRSQKITLDFAGRRVVECHDQYDAAKEFADTENIPPTPVYANDIASADEWPSTDPSIKMPPLVYLNGKNSSSSTRSASSVDKRSKTQKCRLQDKELQEISDEGMCLSIHQPYASLLTLGIKKHEGRTWYAAYRGRLWIHAGQKVPSIQEIRDVENTYKLLHEDECLYFPDHYHTGCLLGCVDLVDCLPQEEYREQFPDGESSSPFVLICANPQELVVKFPMRGKNKIFQMDPNIHGAVKKMIAKISTIG